MARMIPPALENTDNKGEKLVFETLKEKTPNDWVVRCNLRCSFVSTYPNRHLDEVESDFVVLIPGKGLVFLEVKSSYGFSCSNSGPDTCTPIESIENCCINAQWKTISRDGTERVYRNPFDQVWEAKDKQMRALCSDVLNFDINTERYKREFPGVYAHLVVYPQGILREGRMPLQAPCVVVTSKDMPKLKEKIEQIVDLYPQALPLPHDLFDKIVKYFEAEVHIDAIKIDPDTLETELARLTDKQKDIAEKLLTEDQDFIVYGCCGSGKTMIATWLLKHKVNEGKKVLYLCYNRMLAASLQLKLGPDYEIETINQLIAALARRAGVQYSEQDLDGTFENACLELDNNGNLPHYDVIIIDEAQDIRSERQFDCFEFLGRKGFRKYVFADPNQKVYHNGTKVVKVPLAFADWSADSITLNKDCRNTKRVAAYVKEIKRTGSSVFDEAPQGITPQILPVRQNPMDLLQRTVNNILSSKEYPWPASSFAILVLDIESLNQLENVIFHGNIGTTVYHSDQGNEKEVLEAWYSAEKIIVSTIHAFKGLEADIIILYNFASTFAGGNDSIETLAYVGASRPHGALYIIPKDKNSREYCEQFLREER